MNQKYTLLLSAMLVGTGAWAQHVSKPHLPSWARPQVAEKDHSGLKPHQGAPKVGGDIVWTEDFANGLAGNNGSGAWTVDGPDSQWWVYSFTGPNGAYSNNTEVIGSTTASNGFMIFQSDSGNTDWNANPPAIVSSPINWDAGLVSPVIDLTATPYVRVEFQQRMRYCCQDSPHFLQVSTDGGLNWNYSFPVITAAGNDDPGTLTTSVNISAAIAANPANVQLRFFHDGSNSGSSHYHWQIDDVNIIEAYDYDLAMTDAAVTNWNSATANSWDSIRYSIYPFSQLRPVPLSMNIANDGSADQNGLVVNFTVTEGVNTVLDQDQTVDIPAGQSQRVYVNPAFIPPQTAGTYNVDFSYTSALGDNSTGNDSGTGSFKVSEFTYARDLGTVADYETGDGVNEYKLCNSFHVLNSVDLYAIDVALRNGNTPPVGLPITGKLFADDLETEIAETQEHELVNSDFNGANGTKFISLIFTDPQPLDPLTDYVICLSHLGGDELRTGVNGVSEPQTSFIYYAGQNGLDWYYTTATPMVRMNFNPSVGINDVDRTNGIGVGQNFPNPAHASTTIPYDLAQAANITIEVTDLSGKVIQKLQLGRKGAGVYRQELNTANLSEGVYLFSLTANDTRITKRMTVIH